MMVIGLELILLHDPSDTLSSGLLRGLRVDAVLHLGELVAEEVHPLLCGFQSFDLVKLLLQFPCRVVNILEGNSVSFWDAVHPIRNVLQTRYVSVWTIRQFELETSPVPQDRNRLRRRTRLLQRIHPLLQRVCFLAEMPRVLVVFDPPLRLLDLLLELADLVADRRSHFSHPLLSLVQAVLKRRGLSNDSLEHFARHHPRHCRTRSDVLISQQLH
mmetsp:Transcript_4696/g.17078  ORF Transcript_4696/g.17078 Transcript_4696/m.17078 type:complete len:215 (+) Transcript_4696:377-1021(+)